MKHTKNLVCFLLLSGFSITLLAQSTIPATGGNVSGSGGSVSYTVGQILYSTISGSNGTVVQGVQQPYEISVITGIEEANDISLDVSVYPNPASDFLILVINDFEAENLRYKLYDINGSLIKDNKIEGNETNIRMQQLLPATYILKITHGNIEVKTFKIIKK